MSTNMNNISTAKRGNGKPVPSKRKTVAAPTEAQINFIQLLKSEREVPAEVLSLMRTLWIARQFDTDTANSFIKILKNFPERFDTVNAHSALIGYHKVRNRYFKVYRSESGYMYAKEVIFDSEGAAKMKHVSPMVFQSLSADTMIAQAVALRLDRKLKADRAIS